jgi:hypothetical protein
VDVSPQENAKIIIDYLIDVGYLQPFNNHHP